MGQVAREFVFNNLFTQVETDYDAASARSTWTQVAELARRRGHLQLALRATGEQGIAAFISKPFRLHEVIETFRKVLKGSAPLQGVLQPEDTRTPVQLKDKGGNVVSIGILVDLDTMGAQVDLEGPLSLAETLTLLVDGPEGLLSRTARVRWVARHGDRYVHGLALAEE